MKNEHKKRLNIIKTFLQKLIIFKNYNFPDIEIFVVGGFLRDLFLKKISLDLDFAVNKKTENFSYNFSKNIKGAFIELDEENKSYRIVKKINKKVSIQLDFTNFRGKNINLDLQKRDFTVNSFAINLEKSSKILENLKENNLNEIYNIDYKFFLYPKEAVFDLKHKIIRMNNKSIFTEDPLRILRAIRIFDQKKINIEKKTKTQILENANLINLSAKERIHDEIIKIFSKKYLFNSILFLDETKILENIFGSDFISLKNKTDFYYHKDGLFGHLLETLFCFDFLVKNLNKIFTNKDVLDKKIITIFRKSLKNNLAFSRLVCLFHDIGKPECKSFINDKIHFLNHEEVGAKKTLEIFKNLKFSNKELHFLSQSIIFHMQASNLSKLKDLTSRAIYRFFKRIDENIAINLLLFSAADILASIRGRIGLTYLQNIELNEIFLYEDFNSYITFVRKVLDWFLFSFKAKKSKKFLDGYEIMEILNIPSGKKVGEILDILDEKVALKEINNKKEAKELVKNLYNQ